MNSTEYRDLVVNTVINLPGDKRAQFLSQLNASEKNPVVLFGFNAFLGSLGVDRFLVGDILAGVLKLITFGGLGFWVLIDYFLIGKRTRSKNAEAVQRIAASMR